MNQFHTFGEELTAIFRANENPSAPSRKLASLRSDKPSEGEFLVEPQYAKAELARLYNSADVVARCRKVGTGDGRKVIVPAIDETNRGNSTRHGGLVVHAGREQGEDVDTSKPAIRQLVLEPKSVFALVPCSEELLRAGDAALEQFVGTVSRQALSDELAELIVAGTGAAEPQGLINSPARITCTRDTGNQFSAADVRRMWGRCWGPSRKQAVWLHTQSADEQLLALAGGLLDTSDQGRGDGWPSLIGRPLIPCEWCPALGTEGDVILCDLSEYALAAGQMRVDLSELAPGYFERCEAVFRLGLRVDGACRWQSAVTPANGTDTLSPIVTLAG